MAEIKRVGVLGCGLMGGGIAQVCAQAGFSTIVREVSEEMCARGVTAIDRQLSRLVEKEKISADSRDETLERIRATTRLEELEECDLIMEAVVEELGAKNELWRALDRICPPSTIFASNTSSLSITTMAAATNRPERFVGLHFFNPVPVMKLVEVVRTVVTDDDVFQSVIAFARSLGKEPISCGDSSGFIVNRLLVPYMMDAIRSLEQGLATVEEIDAGMRLGTGHPMGPFELADFVGTDTLDRIGEIMFGEFREARFASPPLLRRIVALGHFGRKSGRGFYDYSQDPPRPIRF